MAMCKRDPDTDARAEAWRLAQVRAHELMTGPRGARLARLDDLDAKTRRLERALVADDLLWSVSTLAFAELSDVDPAVMRRIADAVRRSR
jgi:hypothetical protein